MFERAMFNAAQGARFANGKALTYYSADQRLWVRQRPPEGPPNSRYIYTAAHYPSCCHDSGARVYPYMISSMWMRSRAEIGEGLVATLYGPSRVATEIRGVAVKIVEKTLYPFSFDIEFSVNVERPVEFPIRLRVPSWSAEPSLNAPGAELKRDNHGMLVVSKEWRTGDSVRLTLKPTISGRATVDGTTAVAYGPLVFALPIPEQAEIVRRFPDMGPHGPKNFCAYQYDPVNLVSAKRPLTLLADRPDFGFSVIGDKNSDPRYPWDRPMLRLRGPLVGADGEPETVVLLPMGSTLLRRTCFPMSKSL